MFDMIALACQANLTRVVVVHDRQGSQHAHLPEPGSISDAFHPLSHHQNDPAKIERLVQIQNYHTQCSRSSSSGCPTTQDGDGIAARPLDHPVRQQHEQQRPAQQRSAADRWCWAGATGSIKGGQHLKYPQDTPHANLLLTLLERAGLPYEKLGNSTGLLAEV